MNYNITKLIYQGLYLEMKRKHKPTKEKNTLTIVNQLLRAIISGKLYLPKKKKLIICSTLAL